MMKTEALCVEEHAPHCKAACPLHVDMRQIAGLIRQGKTDKAAAAYVACAPLPHITAKVCDAPCERACSRAKLDGAVACAAVERSLVALHPNLPDIWVRFKLKHRVAVVGSGLSGLTCAQYLAAHGFPVTLFEAAGRMGPNLYALGVGEEDLKRDFSPMAPHVEVRFNTRVGRDVSWEAVLEEYAAVFASGSLPGGIVPQADETTFGAGLDKLFMGGRRLLGQSSPIAAIGNAKRAAISMERLAKRVSLTAMRINEGAYESGLFCPPGETEPQPPTVEGPEGFSPGELAREAGRCLNCHCLVCVRQCRFMRKFEKFPRQYIREIANTIGLLGSGMRSGKNLLVACSMCGLCKELCPNAIPMAEVVHSGRQAMHEKKELSEAIYDFPVRDMLYSNNDASLCRHAPGQTESEYVFFPGCQLIGGMPDITIKTYEHLLGINPKTSIFLGCCGAPADWSGRAALYNETMARLKDQLAALGNPVVLAACPTCMRQMEAAGISVRSLYAALAEHPLPHLPRKPMLVAVHDSCSARQDGETREAVRALLHGCGYGIEELPMSGKRTRCCGYGGLVFYGDKEVAEEMIAERAGESPLPYAAYCSVCRDYLARAGKPALHVLSAVFGQDGEEQAAKRGVDVSEKEYNRMAVRTDLLRKLFSEAPPAMPESGITVPPSVRALMDERLVTLRTACAVIGEAERTGKRLVRPSDGHSIASLRPGIITYWVEYAPDGEGGFMIYNAYSHRVHVMEAEV